MKTDGQAPQALAAAGEPREGGQEAAASVAETSRRRQERASARRWWFRLLLQPLLLLAVGVLLLVGLGAVQRLGWISGPGGGAREPVGQGAHSRYICPMMCTPPQAEPGRCAVCGMELVPTSSAAAAGDRHAVRIDPVARRIAGIQTVQVRSEPVTRAIRTVGQLAYDEGSRKTISAYVSGRLERMYADYTGVVVERGDPLARLYSPQLYSGQVELLSARRALEESRSGTLAQVLDANRELYESARQRLVELGMSDAQIERLERTGQASSRMDLMAPISGTVIEKLAVEGQYVNQGQPICKLADLSTVWLMLKLFPEDAALVHYGQKVVAEMQSLPGQQWTGRVAFVDPHVDPATRTVGVRVVIRNERNRLRVGDYATAEIQVPLSGDASAVDMIYDPELAEKWISPRHPHVIESSPGTCPVCGIDLVPAASYGFTAEESSRDEVLVVPRSAVLAVGDRSVVYAETEPGRFELRSVVLGPTLGERVVITQGVRAGEQLAARGNFLIDSQMQLAGNPSLLDPTKAAGASAGGLMAERSAGEPAQLRPEEVARIQAALEKLSAEDRRLAEAQRECPVGDSLLGTMGTPVKVDVRGTPVFICCEGCRSPLLADPETYLSKQPSPRKESGSSHESGSSSGIPSASEPPSATDPATDPAAEPAPAERAVAPERVLPQEGTRSEQATRPSTRAEAFNPRQPVQRSGRHGDALIRDGRSWHVAGRRP